MALKSVEMLNQDTSLREVVTTLSKEQVKEAEAAFNRLAELERDGMGLDKYLEEWRRHSLESAEREIAWLEELIRIESK